MAELLRALIARLRAQRDQLSASDRYRDVLAGELQMLERELVSLTNGVR